MFCISAGHCWELYCSQDFKFGSTCIPSAEQVKSENCLGQDNETGFEEVWGKNRWISFPNNCKVLSLKDL